MNHAPRSEAIYQQNTHPSTLSRRRMLQGMLAGAGVAAVGIPTFASPASAAGDKILVTLVLEGGNDGLNTVIPIDNGRYRDLRGSLAVGRQGAHPVGQNLYLHPELGKLKRRFDAGDVAIVRGVGEPGLDHSHFSAMAKWMSGRNTGVSTTGWLGRYVDGLGLNEYGAVAIGDRGVPLHLRRRTADTIALPTTSELFGAVNGEAENVPMYRELRKLGNTSLGLGKWAQSVANSQETAIAAAQRMTPTYSPAIPEPTDDMEIVRDMKLAARVINMNVGARVVSASFGDFDSHERQLESHGGLLRALDAAIETFFATLRPEFHSRVVLMTFSEFGRGPAANGSDGIDHGTSSCLFVCGSGVTGGLYGQQPSLTNLDTLGDLRVNVDYRSVYATVLDDYLGADARQVLGSNHDKLAFFKPQPVSPPTTTPPTTPPTTAKPKPKPVAKPVPKCNGQDATIVGTHGKDRIVGTPGRDVIQAGNGDDFIVGRGGNDLICGGNGHDIIAAGPGNDRIFGGRGWDKLNGQAGRDRVSGGPGRDKLWRQAIDFFVRQ